MTSGTVSVFFGCGFGLQWIHFPASVYGVPLASGSLFVTASPDESRDLDSAGDVFLCSRCSHKETWPLFYELPGV